MSGLAGLSVDRREYKGDFKSDLFNLTFYQQHWGEDYGGLSTCNRKRIKTRTHRGLFRPQFANDLIGLTGTEGIGFVGSDREPLEVNSRVGHFAACFSGNLINTPELIESFKHRGHTFGGDRDDIELIAKLISEGEDILGGIRVLAGATPGAYALLLLTEEGIYASLCPSAHWPLVIGKKEGAVAVASESNGFSNTGFILDRDLEPGETVLLREGRAETQEIITGGTVQYCSFFWVYTGNPVSIWRGIPVSLVRKRLGACLARRDIKNGFIPHIVSPVPDSGRFHTIGYHQEFCRQKNEGRIDRIPLYDETLVKCQYTGRSFTSRYERTRKTEAKLKILPLGERFEGLILLIIDDSLVRGTQSKEDLIPKAKTLGVKEVHLESANTEILSHCPWGKTTQRGETLVAKMPSKEKRRKHLGVNSLEYNTIDDLVESIGLPREQLCVDCDLPPKAAV